MHVGTATADVNKNLVVQYLIQRASRVLYSNGRQTSSARSDRRLVIAGNILTLSRISPLFLPVLEPTDAVSGPFFFIHSVHSFFHVASLNLARGHLRAALSKLLTYRVCAQANSASYLQRDEK